MDAVELDGELTTIGRRYFHLGGPRLHLYTADARPWLQASHARYDSIFLDAYRQPYIPFYLLTHEFFAIVRAHLRPGRRVHRQRRAPARLRRAGEGGLGHAARGVPGRWCATASAPTNSLVLASTAPALRRADDSPRTRVSRVTCRALLAAVAGRLGPALRGGQVYTDDLAPGGVADRPVDHPLRRRRALSAAPERAEPASRLRRTRPGSPARRPWGPA